MMRPTELTTMTNETNTRETLTAELTAACERNASPREVSEILARLERLNQQELAAEAQQDALADIFGEPISVYTREQALEDGELVDVTEVAREAGWKYPVALTRAAWAAVEAIPTSGHGACGDVQGRLWDVVWMAMMGARRASGSRFEFSLILPVRGTRKRRRVLVAQCGPGDNAEPVVTIGFSEDF